MLGSWPGTFAHPPSLSPPSDAPGFKPSDISIELHEGALTVNGKRQEASEAKDEAGKVWRSERHVHQFSRCFVLPDNANKEGIAASLVSALQGGPGGETLERRPPS